VEYSYELEFTNGDSSACFFLIPRRADKPLAQKVIVKTLYLEFFRGGAYVTDGESFTAFRVDGHGRLIVPILRVASAKQVDKIEIWRATDIVVSESSGTHSISQMWAMPVESSITVPEHYHLSARRVEQFKPQALSGATLEIDVTHRFEVLNVP
jgi:hypothetical protein